MSATFSKASTLAQNVFATENKTKAKKFFEIIDVLASISFGGKPRGKESVYNALGLSQEDIDFITACAYDVQEGVKFEEVKTKQSKRDICFAAFRKVNLSDAKERKIVIALLVETYGFKKTVVQSYASNYKNDDM